MNPFSRFALLFALLMVVTSVRGELTVSLRPVGPAAQGGFRAQPNERFEWVLAYYALGASKQPEVEGLASFGIVALGTPAPVASGSLFKVSLKQQVRSDGRSGITAGSAFLYEAYATGRLHQWLPGFSYDEAGTVALQSAIAVLEGGDGLVPAGIGELLTSHFGSSLHANERYSGSSVRVMTLTPADGSLPGGDYLVYLPDPVNPENPGMPVMRARGAGTVGGGGGGGGVNPPPVVPPFEEIDDIIEEIVTTVPPVAPPTGDDITSSTPPPPPPPGTDEDPQSPLKPPGEDTFNPKDNGIPPAQVPDHGATAVLLLIGLAALAMRRRG